VHARATAADERQRYCTTLLLLLTPTYPFITTSLTKQKGSIVNASSIAGLGGFPKNAAYTVAKHGVIGLTRTAAKEVGDRCIRVNCIAP
jgi:NAD(P)-dependent dehydrogenase (short-subunit alcohol dehydrogenase family)